MKKLILLTMLFSLTGCGDNNQDDTDQTSTQVSTLQKAEALPAIANYSKAAAPRTLGAVSPLAGWNITNSMVTGASTLIDAIKESKTSFAQVKPNAKQVAEVLRGGAAGIALSIAVDQLLGAVDWVMDPENSQITYKPKTDESVEVDDPRFEWLYSCGDNYQYICQYRYFTNPKAVAKFILPSNPTTSCWDKNPISGCVLADGFIIYANGRKNEKYKPQNLSLEVIAEKVISNADDGSLDAQVATNIAAQNILNDEELAKPVVQELENNARKPPCITVSGKVVTVGTYGYRHDKVPPSKPHYPFTGDHYNLYRANQNPNNGKCFWVESGAADASDGKLPPPNSIPIEPFI